MQGFEVNENNKAYAAGKIMSNLEYSHETCGEDFYATSLLVTRTSEVTDIVPVMVSGRLVDAKGDFEGKYVKVSGQFRSFNKLENGKSKLLLHLFAITFDVMSESEANIPFLLNDNSIVIDGYICKAPVYRTTPLGREITDILVAVNRAYKKSDYIPCIAWGRNARYAANFKVGDRIQIEGRMQSREYKRRISENEYELKTAYEVSAIKIRVPEEGESEE